MDCCYVLVESLLTGELLYIKAHQQHATNGKKNSKERQKARELGQFAQLKKGVNNSAAQQMERS